MENLTKLLIQKIESLDKKLDDVRTFDIPELKIEITKIKDQTSISAKIYSGIFSGIGAILAITTAIIAARWSH